MGDAGIVSDVESCAGEPLRQLTETFIADGVFECLVRAGGEVYRTGQCGRELPEFFEGPVLSWAS
jgi:hypothetical protein